MISIRGVSKNYGDLVAVQNLSLQIGNEFFVFLGPNGAGKTTTINMMTGLIRPTSGTIEMNGADITADPVRAKRSFGLAPEEPALYDKLTVSEFLQFVGKIYRIPNDQFKDRLGRLLDIFELENAAQTAIEELSHGTKQKVSLVSALVHEPRVLILDEPTSGLDPHAVRNLKSILKGLVKNGRTVFMSTHILEIAEQMCDRVGIIDKGKLIAVGTLEEVTKSAGLTGKVSLEDVFLSLTGYKYDGQIGEYLENSQ